MSVTAKETMKYALILFVITAIVGALLSGVNLLTKDKISQNDVIAEQNALQEVMGEAAKTFTPASKEACDKFGVDSMYAAKDEAGQIVGYCFKLSESGYGGKITAVVGINSGKVMGVSVISHNETPGLGANIKNKEFKDQYIGKGEVSVVKAGASDNQINAVSGATISSKAMTRMVNKAIETELKIKVDGSVLFGEANRNGGGANE